MIVVVLLYSMIHLVPGDPASIVLGPRATPEMKEALKARMGLDQPFVMQLFHFFGNVLKGDLGTDVFSNRPVSTIIWEQLPHTVLLIIMSFLWATLLSIPMGCYSAIHQNTFLDRLIGILSVGCIAIPSFVAALYGLLLFAIHLQWLPAIGVGEEGNLWDQFKHLILPALAIGLGWVGYIARLVRASMLEIMQENFIRTARAFGLNEKKVIFQYALRIAVLPTITVLGVSIGYMLSACVFTEIIFARPGIGKLVYDSVLTRNYPVVMGAVLSTTILFVSCTTIADILTAILDPRIRESL